MTPEIVVKLRRSLIRHEGYSEFPYIDKIGKITIGVGYNLSDRGLPDEWINRQCHEDINYFHEKLSQFPWFSSLNDDRQIVLVDMAFMGFKKFCGFKKMIAALEIGDFDKAADEMLDSNWAQQTKIRAIELSNAMRSGSYWI